ncbi:MAG: hypothetical protein ACK4VO_06245 [Pseudobdellovibrio sp.]
MKTALIHIIEEEIKATHNLFETADQFIERISKLFLDEVKHMKMYAPLGFGIDLAEEVQQEVLEIYRIKTYGYMSLHQYRLSLINKNSAEAA